MPDWKGTFKNRARHAVQNGVNTALTRRGRVFLRLFTHGGFVPPSYGGASAGGQSINEGDS